MDMRTLGDTQVLDTDVRPVRLADQWRSQPAVLVWLRHFGCLFCAEQARDLWAARDRIESAGGRLVFIGNGGVDHAREFRDRVMPEATVLTDPGLRSYRAIGAAHGFLSTLGPRTWGSALRAFHRGARQSRVRGHPFQQGGLLIVAPGDRILFAYLSRSAGDHPPAHSVIEALQSVRVQPTAAVTAV